MPYIDDVPDDQAPTELRRLYDLYGDPQGRVANILRIHALNPPSLDAHMVLYRTLMFGRSPLSRRRREMLAVVVAVTNGCHY